MDRIYSHPPEASDSGVELSTHLSDTAARVQYIVPSDATTPESESIRTVVETLAYLHDLGKATTFFQQYLLDDREPDPQRLRHHAPLGSFAAFYALEARGYQTETCLAGFVAVAKHHGQIPDVTEYVHKRAYRRSDVDPTERNSMEKRQTAVAMQIENIDDNARSTAVDIFDAATNGAGSWGAFRDGFPALLERVARSVAASGQKERINRQALSDSCYSLVIRCWSALVLADKTSAAGAPGDPNTYAADKPSFEHLDEYVQCLEANAEADPEGDRTERLNHYRSRARESVLDNVEAFAEDGDVATLTLPTGMGKTLTGLSAAFDLRDRIGGERVVYALPFTSIIDQVVDEVTDIYDVDVTGRLLTAHHHLAETVIYDKDPEKADRGDDLSGTLAESWRAGLTVTTFVQLFESLAGPENTQSMKLPALHDSVVILDEPQSLPLDWWKLVPRLVSMLTDQYGAKVIAMTATQPKLFDGPELVDKPEDYFQDVERVTYELDASAEHYIDTQTNPKSYDSAAGTIHESIDTTDSALAICNTIDSARALTEQVTESTEQIDVASVYAEVLEEVEKTEAVDPQTVADRVRERGDEAVLHLTTRLRPADRLLLIEAAKELTGSGYPLTTVSTQLVEAGVDISFDRVYRDLAPIDSIVQAAGRCNRSFERDQGQVTVWWLAAPDDDNKTPAEAVYNRGTALLPVAADTLDSFRDGDGKLSEATVAKDAVEKYYERLSDGKDVGKQSYSEYVDTARGDKLRNLSLIDHRRAADVFVSRTKSERDLADQIVAANESREFDDLRRLLDETKPLRITVPYYREDSETADALRELPPLVDDEGLYHLDVQQYGAHFDQTTGFVVPESSVSHRLL